VRASERKRQLTLDPTVAKLKQEVAQAKEWMLRELERCGSADPYLFKVKASRELRVGAGVGALALNRLRDCGRITLDERRGVVLLQPDGGYDPDNGVSVCGEDHVETERTALSVEELREAAGITRVVVPPGFDPSEPITKWGDPILPDGRRMRGPLFDDPSVQKALRQGGVLDLYTPYVKHPRIPHLPWSKGGTSDDVVLAGTEALEGREVVVTAKPDGENTTIYPDGHCHARSLDSGYHPGRTCVRALAAQVGPQLPEGWRLCGENMQARHTLSYRDLPGPFLAFSLWDEHNRCLPWDETVEWCQLLEVPCVPVLWRGPFSAEAAKEWEQLPQPYATDGMGEGYVVHLACGFPYAESARSIAKFVRPDFQVDHRGHWQARELVENEFAGA